MKRVVVTGLGMVTPLGGSTGTSWANLIAGKSGTVALDPSRFPRFAPEHILRSLTSRVVAPVSQDFVDEMSASVCVPFASPAWPCRFPDPHPQNRR